MHSDPLAQRFHRRAAEQDITYDISKDGRSAVVRDLRKIGGSYPLTQLGRVEAGDPLSLCAHIALQYTAFDNRLVELMQSLIERRLADLKEEMMKVLNRTEHIADDLAEMVRRYV